MNVKNRKQAGGCEKNGYGWFLENSYFNSRFYYKKEQVGKNLKLIPLPNPAF
jgi:hypothetical protein